MKKKKSNVEEQKRIQNFVYKVSQLAKDDELTYAELLNGLVAMLTSCVLMSTPEKEEIDIFLLDLKKALYNFAEIGKKKGN